MIRPPNEKRTASSKRSPPLSSLRGRTLLAVWARPGRSGRPVRAGPLAPPRPPRRSFCASSSFFCCSGVRSGRICAIALSITALVFCIASRRMFSICGCRLIDDRLDFRLLLRREIQLLGYLLERVMTVAATAAPAGPAPCASGCGVLSKGGTAERKSAEGGKCDEVDVSYVMSDDRAESEPVTILFRNALPATRLGKFVTGSERRRLSSPLVWRRLDDMADDFDAGRTRRGGSPAR